MKDVSVGVIRIIGGVVAVFGVVAFFTELFGQSHSVQATAAAIGAFGSIIILAGMPWVLLSIIVSVFGSKKLHEQVEYIGPFYTGLVGTGIAIFLMVNFPVVDWVLSKPTVGISVVCLGVAYVIVIVFFWLFPKALT